MLKAFFEKYVTSFDAKDALKLIAKRLEKARELCAEHDARYSEELLAVKVMIEDYIESKI